MASTAPGTVMIGHSIGAAVAIHVAGQKPPWPLIGLATSSIASTLMPVMAELIQSLPTDIAITMPPDLGRAFFYGPDWTLHTPTLTHIADLGVNTPSADLVEINTRWAADLPKVAACIDVPLHYVLAEFDGLWETSAECVDTFAGHFSAAPSIDASLWRCVGHNIEHHSARQSLHPGSARVRRTVRHGDPSTESVISVYVMPLHPTDDPPECRRRRQRCRCGRSSGG